MRVCKNLTALLSTLLIAYGAEGANLQPVDKPGNADAGREFALFACAVCHFVATNQPSAPPLTGAPDFLAIANRPDTNNASLRRRLATLPHSLRCIISSHNEWNITELPIGRLMLPRCSSWVNV